jgi:hypothetical protein
MSILKHKYSTTLGGNLSNNVWRLPFFDKQLSKGCSNMKEKVTEMSAYSSQDDHTYVPPLGGLTELPIDPQEVIVLAATPKPVGMELVPMLASTPANFIFSDILRKKTCKIISSSHLSLLKDLRILPITATCVLAGFCSIYLGTILTNMNGISEHLGFHVITLLSIGSSALLRTQRSISTGMAVLFSILFIAVSMYHFPSSASNHGASDVLEQSDDDILNRQVTDISPVQLNKAPLDLFAFTTANSELPPSFVQAWWHMQHT